MELNKVTFKKILNLIFSPSFYFICALALTLNIYGESSILIALYSQNQRKLDIHIGETWRALTRLLAENGLEKTEEEAKSELNRLKVWFKSVNDYD